MAKKKSDQFEDNLKKLQAIVEKLEQGDLPLDEALESFSEGIRLADMCRKKLEEAESKVQMLLQDQKNEWTTVPFEPSSQDEGNT
ncbi:MAG: exodeoxyribonuclease VII small subunit [Syntrophobacteraceae bacterium]|nr:exodeoxyribonuclease VII small subunit [Syntrophobacteraceae bacterium]